MIQELKGHYENQEWVWDTEIDKECNNFILKLNGDLTPLMYLAIQGSKNNLFLSNLPNNKNIIDTISNIIYTAFGRCYYPKIYVFDNNATVETSMIENITPDWSKYIDKDNAVLCIDLNIDITYFAEKYRIRRYKNVIHFAKVKKLYPNGTRMPRKAYNINGISVDPVMVANMSGAQDIEEFLFLNKATIILPSIDLQNIKQINNTAKELKEKYGIEYVEVIATHCYLKDNQFIKYDYSRGYKNEAGFRYNNIDKIITTNSTGMLSVQDKENIKVVDCVEFFKIETNNL